MKGNGSNSTRNYKLIKRTFHEETITKVRCSDFTCLRRRRGCWFWFQFSLSEGLISSPGAAPDPDRTFRLSLARPSTRLFESLFLILHFSSDCVPPPSCANWNDFLISPSSLFPVARLTSSFGRDAAFECVCLPIVRRGRRNRRRPRNR